MLKDWLKSLAGVVVVISIKYKKYGLVFCLTVLMLWLEWLLGFESTVVLTTYILYSNIEH